MQSPLVVTIETLQTPSKFGDAIVDVEAKVTLPAASAVNAAMPMSFFLSNILLPFPDLIDFLCAGLILAWDRQTIFRNAVGLNPHSLFLSRLEIGNRFTEQTFK